MLCGILGTDFITLFKMPSNPHFLGVNAAPSSARVTLTDIGHHVLILTCLIT